ncbi:MAG: magnesium transporter [Paraglaciecola sp.]|nr:magnesium transporter [Paraglaciecola sp.]NCT48386.1 magnesium transporter [Paraglaciecola sp.]
MATHDDDQTINGAHLALSVHFLSVEPQAAARQLELLSAHQASIVLQNSPSTVVAQVLRNMLPNSAAKIVIAQPNDKIDTWLEKLNAADLAAILRCLAPKDQDSMHNRMPRNKQTLCKMLLSYPEYAVGSLVDTDVLVIEHSMLVENALQRLKKKQHGYLQVLFVVDQSRQLIGQLNISQLFIVPPSTQISVLLGQLKPSIIATLDIASAAQLTHWQEHDSIAVVNRKHEFIGVLHHHSIRHFSNRQDQQNHSADTNALDMVETYADTIVSVLGLIGSAASKK